MMRATKITSCYLGPYISPEQFIAEHFFLYLVKGQIDGYDGHRHHKLMPSECCLVRKNQLARYHKQKESDAFEKVVIIFDEPFLKQYAGKYNISSNDYEAEGAFLSIKRSKEISVFLESVDAFLAQGGAGNEQLMFDKRAELLDILLRLHPEYKDILFDFGKPGKIDLESFMNRNYKFNVDLRRLAYLTGRSLSAFKRDFVQIFRETPSRWLTRKRLEQAYFLISKQAGKPSDIYLDLGFEDLSHFSFAFKKHFAVTPTQLAGQST